MIGLRQPELLLALGIPWALVFVRFAIAQRRAVAWIDRHAAPRFRLRLTRYRGAGLNVHLGVLFLLGLALVVAAAGPTAPGEAEVRTEDGGRILLLVDASASMRAEDPAVGEGEPGGAAHRFGRARGIARELVGRLEGARFALATFSGVATWQLPMTADRELVLAALDSAEIHTFYRSSGSSFAAALDAALHLAAGAHPGLQVVLLSDGETPRDEDAAYDASLDALAESGVPVHTVALGSAEGEGRVIYDFRDIVAGAEEPAVLVRFHTRREERHLRRMARRTGGRFLVDDAETVQLLEREIRSHRLPARVEDPRARRDLAGWLLGLFLAVFVLDAVLFDRRPPRGPSFELERLGPGPARGRAALLLAALLLVPAAGCGDSPIHRAHRENERGIARDRAGERDAARDHYLRSIGHGVRREVPTYNLARSRTLAESWSEAHDHYQQALELDPDLRPALYNDGVTLWRWGEAERDPRGCQLERTLELWRVARDRFATVDRRGGDLAPRAAANERHVSEALAEIETLIADPPPGCAEPPPEEQEEDEEQQQGGGGGGGGGGGSSPPPLTPEEEESVRQALQRIEEQRRGEGKYFRRSGAEQFARESWQNPDAEIWW